MLRRVGVYGLIDAPMNCKIGLPVSIQVQSPDANRPRNRSLDDPALDQLIPSKKILGHSDIHRYNFHRAIVCPEEKTMTNDRLLTRRVLLQGFGTSLTAALLPVRAAVGTPAGPVITKLSTYMSEARNNALADPVIEKAKHHILDTFAAIISGAELTPGRSAVQFARAYGGEKVATVAASNVLCGPIEAALANGVLAHADETDDSWPSGWHPGCNVVPAALAVGEQFGITGAHFVRAVAVGYDIGARMLMALRPGVFETHKSTHSIGGVFGAAAAAGCAASLNPQQMRWLLDYTAQQSSGIAAWDRDTDHIEKGFVFGGMPARSGVTSALLVKSGWTGVDDVLSGDDNFLLANAPHGDANVLIDKLGERYEITRTSIKKWTVGTPIQGPLDALEI